MRKVILIPRPASRGSSGGIIMTSKLITLNLFILYAFFLPSITFATLGEPLNSVDKDKKQVFGAKKRSIHHEKFTVQEIVSDTLKIREFVSPSGIVFGIAWNGLGTPDFNQILGAYSKDYELALNKTPKKMGRRSQSVKGSKVVVERWGHMRNLQGRAYDPELIPEGVTPDEIR